LCYWKTENTFANIELTFKSLPSWVKWCLAIAVFLLLVGLIWGEEGLENVIGIAFCIGLIILFGYLRGA
jgi:hypothetical protein